MRARLSEIYRREEIKWCQRARHRWLKEGDANTTFFHRTTNMQRRNNYIHSLLTPKVEHRMKERCLKLSIDILRTFLGDK